MSNLDGYANQRYSNQLGSQLGSIGSTMVLDQPSGADVIEKEITERLEYLNSQIVRLKSLETEFNKLNCALIALRGDDK